jgi:hypothetical protein
MATAMVSRNDPQTGHRASGVLGIVATPQRADVAEVSDFLRGAAGGLEDAFPRVRPLDHRRRDHPFVVREAHGRKLVLQAARERRLTDAEIAVEEVCRCHRRPFLLTG